MNLSTFIAKRYFLSKRNKNFIHILTIISLVIVSVCTAALIIVLSVFNGLEELLTSLNASFDPEIKMEAKLGKSFPYNDQFKREMSEIPGIAYTTEVIEDYAYVKYKDAEMVITMKGMSDEFIKEGRINSSIVEGKPIFEEDQLNYAIIGRGVQYYLKIWNNDEINSIQVHYIKDINRSSLNPSQSYSKKSILPGGVFSIQKQFDENYIFVPLKFAQELLDYGDKRTSIEIKTNDPKQIDEVKLALQNRFGEHFKIQTAEEQHADLYKLLKIEKLFVFIALVLILGVGSINILFVLSMLAIDKKDHLAILYSLGAKTSTIRKIFIKEGLLISLSGTAIGLTVGGAIVYLQQTFGFVSMGMISAVQSAYPVKMELSDFIGTSICVLILTILVSYRPASIATKYSSLEHLPS